MAAETDQIISPGVVKFRELSPDERAMDLRERREKARRDEAMRMSYAEKLGEEHGIKIGLERGIKIAEERGRQRVWFEFAKNIEAEKTPVQKITRLTGLTREEIESLRF
jgi:hypothetical protein